MSYSKPRFDLRVDGQPDNQALPCLNPSNLLDYAAQHNRPTHPWAGRANSFKLNRGKAWGVGFILLSRKNAAPLDLNASYTLTISDAPTSQLALHKLRIVGMQAVYADRSDPSDETPYLIELADRRRIFWMSSIDRFWNVRAPAASGTALLDVYLGRSGAPASTSSWQGMLDSIWTLMPRQGATGLPLLPFTPDGLPEGFRFHGMSAFDAYCSVLAKLNCELVYRPDLDLGTASETSLATTFSIVQLGSSGSQLGSTIAQQELTALSPRLMDDFAASSGNAANLPATIRVFFRRQSKYAVTGSETSPDSDFAQPANVASYPSYSLDVATGLTGSISGTVLPIWDDMPALFNQSMLSIENYSDVSARATEVANNWKSRLTLDNSPLRKKFFGLVTSFFPGSEIEEVLWADFGGPDGLYTELRRGLSTQDDRTPFLKTSLSSPLRSGSSAGSSSQLTNLLGSHSTWNPLSSFPENLLPPTGINRGLPRFPNTQAIVAPNVLSSAIAYPEASTDNLFDGVVYYADPEGADNNASTAFDGWYSRGEPCWILNTHADFSALPRRLGMSFRFYLAKFVGWFTLGSDTRGVFLISTSDRGEIYYGMAAENWAMGSGGPDTVLVNPCDNQAGSGLDTGTSLTVNLQGLIVDGSSHRINPRDPNVVTGNVLRYIRDPSGVAWSISSGLLDDPIKTLKPYYSGTIRQGWALADGTANATGNGGTGKNFMDKFLKFATVSGTAGGGATLQQTDGPDSTTVVQSGSGATVASSTHKHYVPDAANMEPANLTVMLIERLNNSKP